MFVKYMTWRTSRLDERERAEAVAVEQRLRVAVGAVGRQVADLANHEVLDEHFVRAVRADQPNNTTSYAYTSSDITELFAHPVEARGFVKTAAIHAFQFF